MTCAGERSRSSSREPAAEGGDERDASPSMGGADPGRDANGACDHVLQQDGAVIDLSDATSEGKTIAAAPGAAALAQSSKGSGSQRLAFRHLACISMQTTMMSSSSASADKAHG